MGQVEAKLEDRYHLQKVKLGQGSFGVVWRAVDKANQEVVAIKQLDKSRMPKRGVSREDVEKEIRIMAACRHRNLLDLLATFENDKYVSLALEYCDGGDFGDKVKERGQNLQQDEAVSWMHDIASGVAALHAKGICHRDIKPDNFMVKGEPGSQCIKLADFGLACFMQPGRRQLLTLKCGTPAFMAPEVHLLPGFSRGYSLPCDIWAVGVVLSMLMHGGQHPFMDSSGHLDTNCLLSGTPASEGLFNGLFNGQSSNFSDEARQLCRKMLDTSPEGRLSAEDALRSPWFRSRGFRHTPSAAPSPSPSRKTPQAAPTGSPAAKAQAPSPGPANLMGKLMQAMVDVGDSSPVAARTPVVRERAANGSPKRSPQSDGRRKPPALPSPAIEGSTPLRKDPTPRMRDGRGPSSSPMSGSPTNDVPTPCRVPSYQRHIRF
jgi:serine/threonine protein kinase